MAGTSSTQGPRSSSGMPKTKPSQYVPLLKNARRTVITSGSRAIFNIGAEVRTLSAAIPFDMSGVEKVYASKPEDLANMVRAIGTDLRQAVAVAEELSSLHALSNFYMERFAGVLKGHDKVGLELLPFPVQLGETPVTLPVIIDASGFRVVRTGMYADVYALKSWWTMEVQWPVCQKKAKLNFDRGLAELAVEDLLKLCKGTSSRLLLRNTRNRRSAVINEMVFPKHFVEEAASKNLIIPLALGARFKDELEIEATGPSSDVEAEKVKQFLEQPANEYQLP